jgi:hypothetical protein
MYLNLNNLNRIRIFLHCLFICLIVCPFVCFITVVGVHTDSELAPAVEFSK